MGVLHELLADAEELVSKIKAELAKGQSAEADAAAPDVPLEQPTEAPATDPGAGVQTSGDLNPQA